MHRGRGRPPGSKKIKDGPQAAPSAEDGSRASSGVFADKKAQSVGAVKKPTSAAPAAVVLVEPRAAQSEAGPGRPSSSTAASKKEARLGTGIDAAVHAIGKLSRRLLKPHESDVLQQVRQWAPLCDVELAMNVLHAQRASLLERCLQSALVVDLDLLPFFLFSQDTPAGPCFPSSGGRYGRRDLANCDSAVRLQRQQLRARAPNGCCQ